jgi:hypothetical protein
VAAYKWDVAVREISNPTRGREDDYFLDLKKFPPGAGRTDGYRPDKTILPLIYLEELRILGLMLRPASQDASGVEAELAALFASNPRLKFRVASETSPGEFVETDLKPFLCSAEMVNQVFGCLKRYFPSTSS